MRPDDESPDDDDEYWEPEPFELTDELDLHTFQPRDVSGLIPDYIDECLERGFPQVRIIHGKGKGVLRRIVHAALERHPRVASFELGDLGSGSWGATLAVLEYPDDDSVGDAVDDKEPGSKNPGSNER